MMNKNFHPANSLFLEELYESWLENHESVPSDWQEYFQAINGATTQFAKAYPRQATPNKIWLSSRVGWTA